MAIVLIVLGIIIMAFGAGTSDLSNGGSDFDFFLALFGAVVFIAGILMSHETAEYHSQDDN